MGHKHMDSEAMLENVIREFLKENVISRDLMAARRGAGKTTIDVTHGSIEKFYVVLEECKNRKEARTDANNMLLDKGEFPDTEAAE